MHDCLESGGYLRICIYYTSPWILVDTGMPVEEEEKIPQCDGGLPDVAPPGYATPLSRMKGLPLVCWSTVFALSQIFSVRSAKLPNTSIDRSLNLHTG
jgi:hypothetical protein